MRRIHMLAFIIVAALALGGCAMANGPAPQSTSSSGLSAGNMDLSAQMSSSIFLQPVARARRVVYVDGHNTSSAQSLRLTRKIDRRLSEKDYRVTNNLAKAEYMLMYNILYVGKQSHHYTSDGALAGAASNSATGTAIGGVAGAVIGGVIVHFFQHKDYMMVVDIQLEQRQKGAYTSTSMAASQGRPAR